MIYFLITGLLVIAPALYNRYPLMYFDSGAYMEMAVIFEPSFHRAMGYPLLMKLSGFLVSNWPIVIIQGVLISVLLYRLVARLIPSSNKLLVHFSVTTILLFTSALPWYASQLMPDIFTFILVLATTSYLIEKNLKWSGHALYLILIVASTLTHLSNLPMLLLLLVSVGAINFIGKSERFTFDKLKWSLLGSTVIISFLIVSSFNAAYGMGFRLSLASNTFITANLGEMGILKFYLDEKCPDTSPSLCSLKDNLPKETYGYLWDPNGPVQQHEGGWEGANEEYAKVVHDFLTEFRYSKWLIVASVKATVKQMFQIELGSGLQYAYGEGTPPYWPMRDHFKQELNEYLTSVQNKGDALPLDFFSMVNYLSLFISLLIIGQAVLSRSLSLELAMVLIIFLLAYFFNAAITGVLANVYERLQCRLLPLIQLTALLILFQKPNIQRFIGLK